MSKKIILKPGRDESVKRFHPWIFSGAIKKADNNIEEGDTVAVYSSQGDFLGRGHYQNSSITVRLLTFSDEELNADFYRKRITEAYNLRKRETLTHNSNTNTYRLIHGEGDLLPGLIVDIYNDIAVFQAHSLGMYKAMQLTAPILTEVNEHITCVYNKSSATIPKYGDNITDEWVIGNKELPVTVSEHGCLFEINPDEGQKTGFFIDQRENRFLLQKYAENVSVLNMFCYTGGFSVYALKGGASKVVSVDSSAKAIALANRNVEINFGKEVNHTGVVADVFNYFRDNDELYDVIILDPPAFAKHHSAVKNALQAYKRINAKAMERLKPGGILFTFSCSQAINKQQFLQAVFSAAAITKKQVSILHHLTQPADHPVNIYHPEGEYLKGLVLYNKN